MIIHIILRQKFRKIWYLKILHFGMWFWQLQNSLYTAKISINILGSFYSSIY